MCGIAGLISTAAVDDRAVARLIRPIAHRGPDDDGIWIDAAAGVGLGHRRLAIVDLSPAGHQPMHSADGRLVLTFNGEIYNHAELRARARSAGRGPGGRLARPFRHRDFARRRLPPGAWPRRSPQRVGMFAFALWDRKERTLSLVRDRFGEKPLYYGWAGKDFLFGSELKALRAHPRFDNAIDRRALRLFAARTYIPAPLSIYERRLQARAGLRADGRPPRPRRGRSTSRREEGKRGRPQPRALLVLPRRGPARARRSDRRRGGSARRARAGARPRRSQGQVDGRRAGRRVPVGRDRQLDHRRALPEIFVDPGAHLLDRLRGGRLQRGRARQARSPQHLGTDPPRALSSPCAKRAT